jgi:hypothetical protein
VAKRYTKTTRPSAGPPRPKRQVSLAAPRSETELRTGGERETATLWPELVAPPAGPAPRASSAGPARRPPLPNRRLAPVAVPATARRLGGRLPSAQRHFDLEEEMAYIRSDIRHMFMVSGVIFLLLIALGLVLL